MSTMEQAELFELSNQAQYLYHNDWVVEHPISQGTWSSP